MLNSLESQAENKLCNSYKSSACFFQLYYNVISSIILATIKRIDSNQLLEIKSLMVANTRYEITI